jgi:hypothetical protein
MGTPRGRAACARVSDWERNVWVFGSLFSAGGSGRKPASAAGTLEPQASITGWTHLRSLSFVASSLQNRVFCLSVLSFILSLSCGLESIGSYVYRYKLSSFRSLIVALSLSNNTHGLIFLASFCIYTSLSTI